MGFPLFRFTLSNDIEGSIEISEPGGWDEAKLILERNPEFHSLVEMYDQPLTFYGADNANNGGIDYIRNIERTQGIDAQITITIEISNDEGDTYETVFEGVLDIESAKEIDFYKLEMGVNRNDFWQKFVNRKDTPVNIRSLVDLDGDSRIEIDPITLQLPSQKIRLKGIYRGQRIEDDGRITPADRAYFTWPDNPGSDDFYQYVFGVFEVDEIKERYNIGLSAISSLSSLVNFISTEFAGTMTFNSLIELRERAPTVNLGWTSTFIDFYIRKNDDTPIAFAKTDITVGGTIPRITQYTLTNESFEVSKGDLIYLYAERTPGVQLGTVEFMFDGYTEPSSGHMYQNYIDISLDSVYPDTDCEAFLIHEAFNAITDRIIGRDGTFYSEYLGNQLTQVQSYLDDGCGSNYALTRILNIRGYNLDEKPFFMSLDTCWNGANPILNLGLGYDRIGSPEIEVIRCEPKSHFYDDDRSIDFDYVNNIERSYDMNYVFKLIEIGYERWSAESSSGIDDPQTKRIYNTRFKTVGKELKVLSKFIGASLTIEQARRNRSEKGKDYVFDDNVAIVAVNPNTSPQYQPELDENFTDVTGLLNAETRYNIRISVARNFERWQSFFNGCLQWYTSDEFKFASGEGNFDMTSTLDSSDCEASDVSPEPAIDEKGNFSVTDDHLFMPIIYTFEHPMTWDQYRTIRENRNKAIGVSRTDINHKTCFIMNLEYEITHGKAQFVVAVKDTSVGFDSDNVYFDSSL